MLSNGLQQQSSVSLIFSQARFTEKPAARKTDKAAWICSMASILQSLTRIRRFPGLRPAFAAGLNIATLVTANSSLPPLPCLERRGQ